MKDDNGNSVGGVRSPYLDAPLATYVGNDGPGPLCALAGYETPFTATQLQADYKTADAYMKQFTKSLDQAIKAGTILKDDRAEILTATQATAQQRFAGS